jgi:hypothetical protein
MTPSQIVIGVPMAGSAISVIQRVLVTTTLIGQMQKTGLLTSEPLTLTEMYISQANPTSCPILRINFVAQQSVVKSESPTSSLQGELHRLAWAGAGASILEATRITLIAMYLSLNRAIQIVRSLIYRS